MVLLFSYNLSYTQEEDSVLACVGESGDLLVGVFRLSSEQACSALLVLGVQAAAVVLWASDAQSIQVTDWSGGHSGDLEGTLPGMTIVPFAF